VRSISSNLIENGVFKPLSARKLTLETAEKFGYQIGKYKGELCHIAPYYHRNRLVAQHCRFENKDFIWTGNSKIVELFGQHLWKPGGRRLIITEGEIDAMSCSQVLNHKWPVVSIPSGAKSATSAIKRNLEFVSSFKEIVLAFDDDEEGKNAVEKVMPLLPPGQVYVVTYSGQKDANDMLKQGKGAQLASNLWNAEPYRPDGIIAGKDLWNVLQEEPVSGYSIPYSDLNRKLEGIRPGRLYLFTAGSGIGKSTLVNELAYHLMMEHNQIIGVLALEESIRRNADRYLSIYLNKPIHIKRTVSKEKLREAFEAVLNNGRFWIYDHWGSTHVDNLLSKIRYMATALGVQWIVLDHISIVVSGLDGEMGESERQTIDKLMTKLRGLIEETGIGVLAVVHLKRPQGQGKSYNEGRQVSLTDLRGSGSLEQLSDVVIALERNQHGDDPNRSVIRLLKDRDLGQTGLCDTLIYNQETGRMLVDDSLIYGAFKDETVNTDF